MPQKLTRQEFASQLKAKYPVYADLHDEDLIESVLKKYPVYAADVDSREEALAREVEGVGVEARQRGWADPSKPVATPAAATPPTAAPPDPNTFKARRPFSDAPSVTEGIADAWGLYEQLASGATFGGVPAAPPTTTDDYVMQFAGAMGVPLGAYATGGASLAGTAGFVQGATGALGRGAQQEQQRAAEAGEAPNFAAAAPAAAAKALLQGGANAAAVRLPLAYGASAPVKLATGPAIGAAANAAPIAAEQLVDTGTVDLSDPTLRQVAGFGAAVGAVPAAAAFLGQTARGARAVAPKVGTPVPKAGTPPPAPAPVAPAPAPLSPAPIAAPADDLLARLEAVRQRAAKPAPAPTPAPLPPADAPVLPPEFAPVDAPPAAVAQAAPTPSPSGFDPIARIQEKLARGEQIGSGDLRADLEIQQRVNNARSAEELHRLGNELAGEQARLMEQVSALPEGAPARQTLLAQINEIAEQAQAAYAKRQAVASAAPAAAAPSAAPSASTRGWQQTGPARGSNPGGFFTDPDGTQWYVKQSLGEGADALKRAQTEVLASRLYRAAGVDVPEVMLVEHGGGPAVASRIIPDLARTTPEGLGADPRFGQGVAADAWLGNVDAIGTEFDNVMAGPQGPVRVDLGGSLGVEPSGARRALAHTADELDAFRAPENPFAAILARQPEESLRSGASKLAQLDDTRIHQIIEESGYGSPQERAALADTLISRRDDVVRRLSAESGQPVPAAAPLTASGEQGFMNPMLATRLGGAMVGGSLGAATGEDGKLSLGGAAFGAVAGALTGKFIGRVAMNRAQRALKQAYKHHGGADEALKVVHPAVRGRFSDGLKELLDEAANTFTSFDELKRAEGLHNSTPGFYSPAIDELSQHYTRRFQWPMETLQKVTHALEPLKSYRQYKHAFDILRLRRDIEELVLDVSRRQDGFQQLTELRKAKGALQAALQDSTKSADRADLMVRYTAVKEQMAKVRHRLPKKRDPNAPLRKGMSLEDAEKTLKEAMATASPEVLETIGRVKGTLREVGEELVKVGALDEGTLTRNAEYFPDFVLKHLGKTPVGVRAGKGVSYTRLGAVRQRKGRDPETAIWNDLAGPLMKRMLDQRAMIENVGVIQRIVQKYDARATGVMPSGETTPPPGYTKWVFHDTGKVKSPVVEGIIPIELAKELKARFTPLNTLERAAAGIRKNMSGWLLRWSGLPFIARNVGSDTAHAYASTKASEWLSLPQDQMKAAIAAELYQRYRDPSLIPPAPAWMRKLGYNPDYQGLWSLADRAERAGAGTAAASAEVTEATLRDPHLRNIARDPARSVLRTAGDVGSDFVSDAVKNFDDVRAIGEGTNRLALFMRAVRNGVEDAQAGKIVNLQQGRYDEGWYSPREQYARRVGLVPFYAWQKIAANQWIPYLANEVASEGKIISGRRAAGKAVLNKYKRIAPWTLVAPMVWNHVFFPEAEAQLSDRQKANPHLIVPDPLDPWNEQEERWNLKLITLPGGANNVARLVGAGGLPNRLVHMAKGTGSTSFDEEWEFTWKQAKEHYLSLAGTIISIPGSIATGTDWVTGTPIDRRGAGPLERFAGRVGYAATAMPPMRHVEASAREAQMAGGTTADMVLQRLITGGVYQDINPDVNVARAVRRAISEGYTQGARVKGERERKTFSGEQPIPIIGKDEAAGMSGVARAQWKALASDLLELNKRASADLPPDAPGAAERAQGPLVGAVLNREGLGPVPTDALMNQWGPDKSLKMFFGVVDTPGMESWATAMRSIAERLSESDQRWEIPLAIMQMLKAETPMDVDVDILKRLRGLADAKQRQKTAPLNR